MKQEINEYKSHCTWRPVDKIVGPTVIPSSPMKSSTKSSVEKNFNAQIAVSPNTYKIPITYTNNTVKTVGNGSNKHGDGSSIKKFSQTNDDTSFKFDTIINSVENFQLVPKPLVDSLADTSRASTTSGSKTSESNDGIKMNMVPNAPLPEQLRVSSTTAASRKSDENKLSKHMMKQVPNGVVPFQTNLDDISIKTMDKTEELKPQENNRYSNIVAEANEEKKDINESLKELQMADGNSDTGAREVNDNNDFVVDEHNHQGHVQDTFDHKDGLIDNAAEEDLNVYGKNVKHEVPNGSDDDLQVIHRPDEDHRLPKDNQLKNEVNADQGNAYPDEAIPEEPGEDEDGKIKLFSFHFEFDFMNFFFSFTDDDYNGHNGHNLHQEPAIRARR